MKQLSTSVIAQWTVRLLSQVEYARKIAEENKRKEEAENLIELLEKEERELIERLKKTQKLQQHVSHGLLLFTVQI